MVSSKLYRIAGLTELGFTETAFAEMCTALVDQQSWFHEALNSEQTLDQGLSDAIALMVAVQQLPLRCFPDVFKSMSEAARHANMAAAHADKALAAMMSIPEEFRVFEVGGMAASARRWKKLAQELGRFSDAGARFRRKQSRPRYAEFEAFIKLLAFYYRQRSGHLPRRVAYNDETRTYGGKFFQLAEVALSTATSIAKELGCARPSMWPETPNARGRKMQRVLTNLRGHSGQRASAPSQ